ncbi:cell wall-binding repeat-containing protein [Rathayibacter sp. VKM Ac-2760]|uniref:cell wall-binding repeat-containing protein n=1 Tax=Rathayibacter sp. VKM Ac-2760 TaxID=2609253 RepID=UPI001318F3E9|nr:cell wall-binding repeat-containing protein [Rathayibacter sp. VKM Ac-2760]QHC57411.1 hypothetical protein GSU72_01550 [Rathayibacter sp. VKM Ac-2760]
MPSRRLPRLLPLSLLSAAAVLLTGLGIGPAAAETRDDAVSTPVAASVALEQTALTAADPQEFVRPDGTTGSTTTRLRADGGAWSPSGADDDATVTISGSVVLSNPDGLGDPSDYAFYLRVETLDGTWAAEIEDSRTFSFTLPAGQPYFLRADVGDVAASWAPTWYGDTPVAARATGVSESAAGLVITLPRATSVSGVVSNPQNVPDEDYHVQAWWVEPGTGYLWKLDDDQLYGRRGLQTPWKLGGYDILPVGYYVFRLKSDIGNLGDEYFDGVDRLGDASVVTVPVGGRTGIDFAPTEYLWHVARIAGSDRYATAVETTRAVFSPGLPVLYVASGATWPDALSAGPAAAAQGGALLLTDPDRLPPVVADEIRRLDPARIVVVGSPLTVSDRVLTEIGRLAPTTRIAGKDRYETSRRIVEDAFPAGSFADVFLATGTSFPDALSVAPIAGRRGEPVLLVDGARDLLDEPTAAAIARLSPVRARLLGGIPSISNGIRDDLEGRGIAEDVGRIGGSDRHDTSRLLNSEYPPSELTDTVFLANATGFADALAAGPAAAALGAPLYLSEPGCIPYDTYWTMKGAALDFPVLLGGPQTLSDDVARMRTC